MIPRGKAGVNSVTVLARVEAASSISNAPASESGTLIRCTPHLLLFASLVNSKWNVVTRDIFDLITSGAPLLPFDGLHFVAHNL